MSQMKDYYEGKDKLWAQNWYDMFRNGSWASDADFTRTMSPEYDSYHPYCCNTCKRGRMQNVNLVRCSGCKIVKYCCKNHQKMDWPIHKKWCKAYAKVVSEEDKGPQSSSSNQAEWMRKANETNMQLMMTMGDLRHTNHIQMAGLQPHCRRCYRSGRIQGVDLVVCPGCNGVAVCKSCLGDDSATSEGFHNRDKDECEAYLTYLCCSGMVVEHGSPLLAACDTNCDEIFHPKDWFEYFEKKGNDFDRGTEMPMRALRVMAPVTSFLTGGLTMPLTLNMFLGKLDLLNKSEVCVHILGGDASEFMVTRVFVELGRLNPHMKRLDLVMVGPNLPMNKSYSYREFTAPHESPCHLDGKLEYVVGLYHNSIAANRPPPDCFVAFNSGIDDPSHFGNWQPTLELVKGSLGIPLCITGFTFLEVENATKNLKRMGFQDAVPPTANPFRSMRPFVDPSREETDFYYSNKAYAIVKGS